MQIVIIGNGLVGDALISSVCTEGHNVTVIDEDSSLIDEVVNKYDVCGIVGNGASVEIQPTNLIKTSPRLQKSVFAPSVTFQSSAPVSKSPCEIWRSVVPATCWARNNPVT